MKKILLIDPWCFNGSNLYYYTTGLAQELSKRTELTVVTQSDCILPKNASYKQIPLFFPKSEKMKRSKMRLFIRGIEYINAYHQIVKIVKREKYDVVHIEWPLMYSIDSFYYNIIRRYVSCFVIKAHNILPHSTGMKYYSAMRKIYRVADVVLVHGQSMKEEFIKLYPEYSDKIHIQRHGVYVNHDKQYDEKRIDLELRNIISCSHRVYLFFGIIHFDKGVDRLVDIWRAISKDSKSQLIIAGRIDENYSGIKSIIDQIKLQKDIFVIKGFVDDNTANYLFSHSNLVILPYRDGSMSGVAFTSAEFAVPILTTDFGVISEYIHNGTDGFVVENSDLKLQEALQNIESNINNEELKIKGRLYSESIANSYEWSNIAIRLLNEVYSKKYRNRD